MSSFLTLQQELGVQVGLDPTISNQSVLLKRWLNNAQQVICRYFEWPFLRNPTPLVVQTSPDITTGTVATIAGSTSLTFSTTPVDQNGSNVSVAGRYIQTVSSNDWYRVTAHTSGTTAATLEAVALYTAAAATYTVRKIYYSTDATVDRIIQVTQDVLPYQLQEISPEYFQSFNPGFLSSGPPRLYLPAGVDSNGYPQFRLWPNPSTAINLSVYYIKLPVDMVADADISVVPAKWHTTVLVEGAKVQAYSFDGDDRYVNSVKLFNAQLEEMKNEYEIGLNRHRVMTSIDNQPGDGGLTFLPLPFNYPRGS